jgi:hypothetical protein
VGNSQCSSVNYIKGVVDFVGDVEAASVRGCCRTMIYLDARNLTYDGVGVRVNEVHVVTGCVRLNNNRFLRFNAGG